MGARVCHRTAQDSMGKFNVNKVPLGMVLNEHLIILRRPAAVTLSLVEHSDFLLLLSLFPCLSLNAASEKVLRDGWSTYGLFRGHRYRLELN